MHYSPNNWTHAKPGTQSTANQRALYSCRSPWPMVGAHGVFKMPCRKCGSCLGNRKNDLVGRMLAEAMSCYDVWVMTLTYDDARLPDPETEENGAYMRYPEHIAKMVNALRMQGLRATGSRVDFTYFAVWERGELHGRGHWHLIIFWRTEASEDVLTSNALTQAKECNQKPQWMPETNEVFLHPAAYKNVLNDPTVVDLMGGKKMRQEWSVWPHGKVTVHAQFRGAHTTRHVHKSLVYCTKYVTKERQRYLQSHGMGEAFFRALMRRTINEGMTLNDLTYTFCDQRKLANWGERLKEKRATEAGYHANAGDRARVYQIQGVMRQRCVAYAIRLKRQKVKERYRRFLAKSSRTIADIRADLRNDLSLHAVGPVAVKWQWERMRYASSFTTETLERLAERAASDPQFADELADIGSPRIANRVDTDGPQFRLPPLDTAGAQARLRACAPASKRRAKS